MAAAARAMTSPRRAGGCCSGRAAWAGCSGARGASAERRIVALPPPLSAWTGSRDLPVPPAETFREQWLREGRS